MQIHTSLMIMFIRQKLQSYTNRHYCHTLTNTTVLLISLLYDRWSIAYSWSSWRNLWIYYIYFLFTDSVVSLSLSPWHGASSRWGWRKVLQTWRVAANILNKQSGQKWNGGPSALCLGELVTNSRLKYLQFLKILHKGVVNAILNTVMDRRIQQDQWNSSNTWGIISFIRTTLLDGVSSVDLLT